MREVTGMVLLLRKALIMAIKTEALLACREPFGDGPTLVHRAMSTHPTRVKQ
jgi:hypothetical protein